MTPALVALICAGIFVAILIWDAFLYSDKVERNSISQVVIDLTKRSPLVPWAIGFMMGFLTAHFYG